MTATLPDVTPRKKAASSPELDAAKELVRLTKEQGLALTGPDGLLKALTKTVLETALNEELTEHLGYDKHDPAGQGSGNVRNGTRSKTVLTDTTGPVTNEVPRDRAGTVRTADRAQAATSPDRGLGDTSRLGRPRRLLQGPQRPGRSR
jgi:putative transposase